MTPSKRTKMAADVLAYEGLLHRITSRIRQSLELQEILSATVSEVRSFLQTNRVKIYRFHADGSGQVIAESIAQNCLPSLLGLNFPAGDIPPSAREMFIKAHQRSIVDIAAQRIILSRIDAPLSTGDLTVEDIHQKPIEDILQRPVDPCHVDYLTRMGVQSSLVVPILHQHQLWGLLVSHHAQPHAFQEEDLQLVQLIADQLSIAIAQSELLSQTRQQVRREATINQITRLLHSPSPLSEILQLVLEGIVRAVHSCGGRLYLTATDKIPSELYTYGTQPTLSDSEKPALLEESSLWQDLMQNQGQASQAEDFRGVRVVADLYQDPQLNALTGAFQSTSIRGMLVMPLRYGKESLGCLTLFRNAINTEILWAGYWERDDRQQRPRESFEMWREYKKNQAPEWTGEDIDLIESLGIHLAMAIMQNRLYQLEMHNRELHIARAAAEESNRMKSNFLASTSHELRTPLASTVNLLQILKKGFYKNEDELKKYIQLAEQSARNLVAIVNDILDIAKIEAGRMSVDLEPVSLKPLLEEQHELFSLESQRKGIALIIECEGDRVYADKGKLRQVLTNLISNAFKFTDRGEIRIGCALLEDKSIVEILVTDTGIGIEMSQHERLFEPFVQENGSIKRQYGGTGLGLAICKQFVELMEGEIQLHSPGKGRGTTVKLRLANAPTDF